MNDTGLAYKICKLLVIEKAIIEKPPSSEVIILLVLRNSAPSHIVLEIEEKSGAFCDTISGQYKD